MNSQQLAQARCRAYALLGDLFLHGPLPETWSALRAISELAPLLAEKAGLSGAQDEVAAEHHRVLTRQVFPFESVFLGDQGLMSDAPLDHLGDQLHHLALLSGTPGPEAQREALSFLDHHLLRWFPCLRAALGTVGSPLYKAAAILALDLATDHRATSAHPVESWALPPNPTTLDDPGMGIRGVAQHLVIPALSGAFLTRNRLERIATELDLPPGFGRRVDVLENLFGAGARYGSSAALLHALRGAFQEAADALRAWEGPGPHTAPWLERLQDTERMLGRMDVALDSFLREEGSAVPPSAPGAT